jgi:hypothetical protein
VVSHLKRSLEFVVDAHETDLVVDAARAAAGDALERVTVAPIDGTPRYRVIIALRGDTLAGVMRALMSALDSNRAA